LILSKIKLSYRLHGEGEFMTKKKINYYLDEKNYAQLKELFFKDHGVDSDNYSTNMAVKELLTHFNATLRDLKIFTEEEIIDILAVTNGWILDFTRFPTRMMCMHELEEYYKLEKFEDFPADFRAKLEGLTEFQIFVLFRKAKSLLNNYEDQELIDKAKYFFVNEIQRRKF